MNFMWETDLGEAENIVLLVSVLWLCFNCQWVRGGWGGAESLI